MTIQDRKEREKEQVKQRIIAVARNLAQQKGWHNVSTRQIAEEIEYSTKKIYTIFENMEAVLFEILKQGYVVLGDRFKQVDSSLKPKEKLLFVSKAFFDFAYEFPELYEVMFTMKGIIIHTKETPPEVVVAGNVVKSIGRELGVGVDEIHYFFNNWWGLCHGLISLSFINYMNLDKGFFETLYHKSLQRFIDSF